MYLHSCMFHNSSACASLNDVTLVNKKTFTNKPTELRKLLLVNTRGAHMAPCYAIAKNTAVSKRVKLNKGRLDTKMKQ